MGRILVTGGAGFIGSALVKRLAQDHRVRVYDDFSRGSARRLQGVDCELVQGDIRDRDHLSEFMYGCDVIFHLAYVGAPQNYAHDPKVIWDIAVNGMANVLDACEKQGGKELFVISSSEAYQNQPEGMTPTPETVPLSVPDVTNPRASYGGGKIISELGAMAYSISGILKRAVVIRPHNIVGPDMGTDHVIPQFVARMLAQTDQTFSIQGTGRESRTFCYIDDLIDAFLLLLDWGRDRNVYHVGSQEEITIANLAHDIARRLGKKIQVVANGASQGAPRRCPDISKVRALGFAPKVPLMVTIGKTVEWYAKEPVHAN